MGSGAPGAQAVREIDADEVAGLARSFARAVPFPHVVIDDFLVDAAVVAASFPTPQWPGWARYEGNSYQPGKMICSDVERMPAPLAALVHECASPRVLGLLEQISGIPRLVPDPYLNGGGLHCSGPGGVLAPHTDFHHYERLGLYRRLNLLVYLTPGWQPGDGGALELYDAAEPDRPARTIATPLGRAVLFLTDHRSVHGFTDPVRGPQPRGSVALYYYTAAEASHYSGDTTTYWRRHERARGWAALRLRTYRALLFVSRGIAFVAHRVNPARMTDPLRRPR